MKFYLAGPIGDVKDSSYMVWRLQVEKHLAALGHTSINPVDENTAKLKEKLENYRELKLVDDVREEMQSILLHDELKVIRADAVLAYVPEYTVGTIREIALAYQRGKPVYVVTKVEKPSNSLIGMATIIFRTFEGFFKYLELSKTADSFI